MTALPHGWTVAKGEQLFDLIRGVTYDKTEVVANAQPGFVGVLRATNIQNGEADRSELVHVPASCVSEKQMLKELDLLIATSSGSRSVVGKLAEIRKGFEGYSFGAFCSVARPLIPEFSKWVSYFSKSRAYRDYVEAVALGLNINNFRSRDIDRIEIPLPPLPEQRRIVRKLDTLCARTNTARTHLNAIERLVGRYRQSVIDAAFSNLYLTVPLLDLVDREVGIPYGIVQTGEPVEGGVPTVRAGDIKGFRLLEAGLKQVDPKIAVQYERTKLRGGEVLIAIRGSVGETCVVPTSMRGNNISREIALVPVAKGTDAQFIMYFLRSVQAAQYIKSNIKGVAQTGINLRDLKQLPCPDLTIAEQREIVRRIETAFAKIDRLAAEAANALKLTARLDQRILAKAFAGELVPQDPNDEPAAVLLERIRAQRGANPMVRRGRRTNPEAHGSN